MNKDLFNWLLFILLSVIWGSSFILMKIGMDNGLNAYQVAALRITLAGIVLLPVAIRSVKLIPAKKLPVVFLSGTLGSLIPAFLFCVAEEKIDSSLAGTLNALTPIFVIVTGATFFNIKVPAHKIIGIAIAFTGMVLLLLSKGHLEEGFHVNYMLLVVLATVLYGFNVNMVSANLLGISSLHLTAVGLCGNALLSLIILFFTGFFNLPFGQTNILIATGAAATLGIFGTAVATIIFYSLVKRASPVFATMVTYGIPFVAIAWGVYYKEDINWKQLLSLVVILVGVYWANRKRQV
ncbi:MAG: DMT family transporter [Ferruginibacter sp.]